MYDCTDFDISKYLEKNLVFKRNEANKKTPQW
jgi:hypothetical protein